ncbi:MAG TPA: Lrp/AsnC ligand binding domain-containing protein [Trichocoleus sp.]|jgi:DNA-binding Lrp family transcriptional regulator
MVTAIVLANVQKLKITETAEALAAIPGITEVYSVAGPYDLAIMVRVKSNDELADFVTHEILKHGEITNTVTLIAFRAYSQYDLEHIFT